jgi:putative PIN family toxin of toxin-antitoxin system
MIERIVIDTNVFVSALRSADGASYRLLSLLGQGRFDLAISEALIHEYEEVAKRTVKGISLSENEIDRLLNSICFLAIRQPIFLSWRPQLKDPGDEHVLDLAIAAGCRYIVTFNKRDFVGAEHFGIVIISPKEFLRKIGEIS